MSFQDVVQLVSWIRVKFADRPFWLFVGFLMLLSLARLASRRRDPPAQSTLGVWLAIVAITTYVAIVFWYFLLEPFFDHAEPSVAAIAWLFHLGKPVYHAPDAAERYAHMYGPMAFIIPASFLAWFGPGIAQAKAAGAAAGLVSLLVVYRLVRSTTDQRNAVMLTGLFAGQALIFRNLAFWIRPDSFAMLFVAIGLLGATGSRPVVSAIVLGMSSGVLVNLKFTGAFYALPAVGLLAATHGVRWVAPAAVTGLLVALWPFVTFDNVSFDHYRYWVQTSASNGLGFLTLRSNIEWALFVLIPVVPVLLAEVDSPLARTRRRLGLAGLALGLTAVVTAASKPGAGPYHVMPFLPAALYLFALHLDAIPARVRVQSAFHCGVPALTLATILVACCQQLFFIVGSLETAGADLARDLNRFADAHPATKIGMGYTAVGERYTYARPVLVFRDGWYLLDAPAVQEFQMSGIALPAATIEAVGDCRAGFWLFPKGSEPFTAPNKYPSQLGRLLFPEDFRRTFFHHHDRMNDTDYFQVWRCRDAPVGASR